MIPLRRLALALGSREHVADRCIRSVLQGLRQVPNTRGTWRKHHVPAVRGQLSRNAPQQCCFPGPVGADQPRGLAQVKGKVDLIQDLHVSKPFGDISACKHRLT